ncbi:hypothetical protein PPL_01024 [Heterostelium album PN500]|uniref:Uncharacterized protein n=1 Tax=Heterostelium pallidum (strain ATCC 26659 / Pp 5 / PN500) TaxID=670386 RepID=D3AXW7_HETP5|nr:hypothetical protein PPL_01024 [Heterostelium album PN500]EFA85794.1 hypothetical protein PPL_01024 [Heterostelium album PN500]|eukprot:XP_020437900.1 hypothetical protein PPL_01024 [Heterostelium album PN500]
MNKVILTFGFLMMLALCFNVASAGQCSSWFVLGDIPPNTCYEALQNRFIGDGVSLFDDQVHCQRDVVQLFLYLNDIAVNNNHIPSSCKSICLLQLYTYIFDITPSTFLLDTSMLTCELASLLNLTSIDDYDTMMKQTMIEFCTLIASTDTIYPNLERIIMKFKQLWKKELNQSLLESILPTMIKVISIDSKASLDSQRFFNANIKELLKMRPDLSYLDDILLDYSDIAIHWITKRDESMVELDLDAYFGISPTDQHHFNDNYNLLQSNETDSFCVMGCKTFYKISTMSKFNMYHIVSNLQSSEYWYKRQASLLSLAILGYQEETRSIISDDFDKYYNILLPLRNDVQPIVRSEYYHCMGIILANMSIGMRLEWKRFEKEIWDDILLQQNSNTIQETDLNVINSKLYYSINLSENNFDDFKDLLNIIIEYLQYPIISEDLKQQVLTMVEFFLTTFGSKIGSEFRIPDCIVNQGVPKLGKTTPIYLRIIHRLFTSPEFVVKFFLEILSADGHLTTCSHSKCRNYISDIQLKAMPVILTFINTHQESAFEYYHLLVRELLRLLDSDLPKVAIGYNSANLLLQMYIRSKSHNLNFSETLYSIISVRLMESIDIETNPVVEREKRLILRKLDIDRSL